jgi:hypothetical protein
MLVRPLVFILLLSFDAYGIESESISNRYGLVGIIGSTTESKKNEAVIIIKNLLTSKSLTLHRGEVVPNSNGMWISSFSRSQVTLSNGNENVFIRNVGSSYDIEPGTQEILDGNFYENLESYFTNELESRDTKNVRRDGEVVPVKVNFPAKKDNDKDNVSIEYNYSWENSDYDVIDRDDGLNTRSKNRKIENRDEVIWRQAN